MAKRVKITTPNGSVFRFDAVFNQSVDSRLTLTSYPVQDGTPVTDHAYREPEFVSISVSVSDIKLSSYDDSFIDVNSRAEKANAILKGWLQNVLLLKIQTKFEILNNMVLVGIGSTNDTTVNSNNFKAILSFRKLRLAQLEEISVGPFINEKVAAFESEYQNNGEVQGTTIVDELVTSAGKIIGGAIAGAAVGAVIGGILGSIVPGAGTIAGAIVGAKIGAVVGGSTGFLTKTWKKITGLFGGN